MEVMMEETFGPVAGIMKVENDDEALALMNDSPYGLVKPLPACARPQLTPDFICLDFAYE
jgi:hypothetical protein